MSLVMAVGAAVAPVEAAPAGQPGTPGVPGELWHEDFEYGMDSGEVVPLVDTGSGGYVGKNGETYTADDPWDKPARWNGLVYDGNSTNAAMEAVGVPTGNTSAKDSLRTLASTLGTLNGTDPVADNHVLAAYTSGWNHPGDVVQFATTAPLPVEAQGRFISFSVNAAATSCWAAHPVMRFFLVDGTEKHQVTASDLDPCAGYVNTGTSNNPSGPYYMSATLTADSAFLMTSDELGIEMRNMTATAAGNDGAIDDIKVLDVTPQLDKHFGAAGFYTESYTAKTGDVVPLTFTVTNTSERGQKTGWSFTDALPGGLKVANVPSPVSLNDCAATVTAAPGDEEVVVTNGSLAAGASSCAITVMVQAPADAGSVVNGADDITAVGLDEPNDATLTVTAPTAPSTCSAEDDRAVQRYWFFGNGVGFDFGTSGDAGPTQLTSTGVSSQEGTTVVTNTGGELQFWTDGGGGNIYNKNHQVMTNGAGVTGTPTSVAAFAASGVAGRYFVVSTSAGQPNPGQLFWTQVNMNTSDGLGEVDATNKNVALGAAGAASEAVTAVPTDDGTGYWVLTYTYDSPNIIAYKFGDTGPTGEVVTSAMPTSNSVSGYGSLAFDADLQQLVQLDSLHSTNPNNNTGQASRVRLLNFDAATGAASLRAEWLTDAGTGGAKGYVADFSPSGRYVYVSKIFSATGGGAPGVLRYDTQAADIAASQTLIGNVTAGNGGQVKRGPDGRMYVAQYGQGTISVIEDPDAATPTFQAGGITLTSGTSSQWGLSQMVTGCPAPGRLEIVKTSALLDDGDVDGDGQADVGDVITYTFTVSNDGASAVEDVTIVDDHAGLSATDPASVDIPGKSQATFTATYTVTQADVDSGLIENTATATGTPQGGGDPIESDPDDDTFVPAPRDPKLAIEKANDVADDATVDVGDVVAYTFTVTNTGNTTMTDVQVADPMPGLSALDPASVASLAPGEEAEFTATYTVDEDDVVTGEVVNTATASGLSPIDDVRRTSDPDSSTATTADADPRLVLDKTDALTTDANDNGQADVDDVVTYTFTVTNEGNLTVSGVTVDDPMEGLSAITPVAPAVDPVTLEPGGEAEFTATYTVTQADLDAGFLRNTATAAGSYPLEGGGTDVVTSPPDSVDSDTLVARPELTIVKSADHDDANGNGVADEGEMIGYSFTVTNTGNTTMENVRVVDPKVTGLPETGVTLAPGEETTIEADPYRVTDADVAAGEVLNTATARGNVPGGSEFSSDPSTATVSAEKPAEKSGLLPSTGAAVMLALLLIGGLAVGVGGVVVRERRRQRLV
ncbi:MAG: LPXTG cell wall anchor domain-containing protein [Aeromicrobium sp.]|uniref:DUF7507 domain-containing protein n=1 Tax=Aeromicrobium sp. TaxID=1871063 RepID=UPI0039E2DF43